MRLGNHVTRGLAMCMKVSFVVDVLFQVLLCPCKYKRCGWQVKLCDPIRHGALLDCFEEQIINTLYKYPYYITLHSVEGSIKVTMFFLLQECSV